MRTLLILFLLIISCSKNSEKFDPNKKVLNQESNPINHLDPQITTSLSAQLQLAKSYEALFEMHPYDPPFALLNNLAKDYSVSKDGKTYTINIRKGVFYHDDPSFKGQKREVEAKDFVTTFQRISDPKLASSSYAFLNKEIIGLEEFYENNLSKDKTDYSMPISGVIPLSKYQLQIKIKNPNKYFPHRLATSLTAPMPMEAIEYHKNDFSNNMIGTGPYILKSYLRKSRFEFIKNPNFRDKRFPTTSSPEYASIIKEYGGKKIPFIDEINVHIIEQAQTKWLQFNKAKIDYLEIPKDNFSESISLDLNVSDKFKSKGIEKGTSTFKGNLFYFGVNVKNPILSNKKVRQAFYYALDQKRFNELFYNKTAKLAQSILPPNIPGNTPPLESPYMGEQIDKAKELLKDAGFEGGKGIPPLRMMTKNSTTSRQIGEFFKMTLKKIGVTLNVETYPLGTVLDKANKGEYDIFFLAWFVGLPIADDFYELVYGKNYPGSYNRFGYQNAEFDKLFESYKFLTNENKQNEIIRKMNQIILEDLPLFPLIHSRDYFLRQGWLKNYVPSDAYAGLEQYYDIDNKIKKKLIDKF